MSAFWAEKEEGSERGGEPLDPHAPNIASVYGQRVPSVDAGGQCSHQTECHVMIGQWDLRWKSDDWFDVHRTGGVTPMG